MNKLGEYGDRWNQPRRAKQMDVATKEAIETQQW